MQACDLVPIVEPEILIDGDYSLQRSAQASQRVLQACVAQLWRQPVDLEATLLKPMMVMPGADASHRASKEDVSVTTLDTMRRWSFLKMALRYNCSQRREISKANTSN